MNWFFPEPVEGELQAHCNLPRTLITPSTLTHQARQLTYLRSLSHVNLDAHENETTVQDFASSKERRSARSRLDA